MPAAASSLRGNTCAAAGQLPEGGAVAGCTCCEDGIFKTPCSAAEQKGLPLPVGAGRFSLLRQRVPRGCGAQREMSFGYCLDDGLIHELLGALPV